MEMIVEFLRWVSLVNFRKCKMQPGSPGNVVVEHCDEDHGLALAMTEMDTRRVCPHRCTVKVSKTVKSCRVKEMFVTKLEEAAKRYMMQDYDGEYYAIMHYLRYTAYAQCPIEGNICKQELTAEERENPVSKTR